MTDKNHFIDFPIFQLPEYQIPGKHLRGENQKKTLIILSSDEDTEDLNTFLAKILSALKLDLQKDTLLLSLPTKPIHLSSLIRQKNIQYIIIFGISPDQLGIHLSPSFYSCLTVGSSKLLFAHPLAEIYHERQQGGKQKAGALWRSLQELFS